MYVERTLVAHEGVELKAYSGDHSVEACKMFCDLTPNCKSFKRCSRTEGAHESGCWMKGLELSALSPPSTDQVHTTACKSYYRRSATPIEAAEAVADIVITPVDLSRCPPMICTADYSGRKPHAFVVHAENPRIRGPQVRLEDKITCAGGILIR